MIEAAAAGGRRDHWDAVYSRLGAEGVSWHEDAPTASLELIRRVRAGPDDPIIDIGGGAARVVDELLVGGAHDVTVLDLSPLALAAARERLGSAAERVKWIVADVLDWKPPHRYAVWHDRAFFHFLVERDERRRYLETVASGLRHGGHAIVGTFAPGGPERCSGLPVARWDPAGIAAEFGAGFIRVDELRTEHVTPGGTIQPLAWAVLRRL